MALWMLPVAGAVASGMAGAYGADMNSRDTNATNAQNLNIARENNQWSAAQAERQMNFQAQMSNTAYRRSVEDMRLAGINPIMAATQGGASSPGGAQGSVSSATMQTPQTGRMLADSASSAFQVAKLGQEIENAKVGNAKTLADTAVSLEQAALVRSQAEEASGRVKWQDDMSFADWMKKREETKRIGQERRFFDDSRGDRLEAIRQQAKQSLLKTRGDKSGVELQELRQRYDKAAAGYDAIIDRVQSGLGTVTSGLNAAGKVRGIKGYSETDLLKAARGKGVLIRD